MQTLNRMCLELKPTIHLLSSLNQLLFSIDLGHGDQTDIQQTWPWSDQSQQLI